jgi:hypothetical protein
LSIIFDEKSFTYSQIIIGNLSAMIHVPCVASNNGTPITNQTTTMQPSFNKRPQIGMTFIHAGQSCVIVKVHKFGTIDIQSPSGKLFRVTGLSFI